MGKKKSKRKINIIALVVILLALYLVFSFVYYIMTLPIKNIYIEGNTYIKDVEIIETAKIKNYPSLIKISRRKVKKNLLKNEFINSVTIKKKLNGTIKIIVDESKPLFYNRTNKKLVLLNGKEVDGSTLYFDSNSDNNMFKKYGSKTASEVATNEN